ncbi:hypothetical protein IV203_033855 [Nitzschia inconspicua]|uniref:Glycosyltransferase family 92 protein n=1 Tax=Nitzschia inconspicua TaxID=303405 RepID=A0A9K3M4X0_9STRA|nr:hypothetical protein IV203_033855 [Nitzschia inconspicua]
MQSALTFIGLNDANSNSTAREETRQEQQQQRPSTENTYASQSISNTSTSPLSDIHTETKDRSTFAACLLVMDDNAILPEFLAYHFLRLPLKRLIVAVDPRSETSPLEILNRYSSKNLMNISIWNDEDFMPPNHEEIREEIDQRKREKGDPVKDPLVNLHRDRQNYFISQCFSTLQREGAQWVIHIDTDEYILPNYYAKPPYKLDMNSLPKNETDVPPTIYDMIQSVKHIDEHLSSPCIALPRVRIGTRESARQKVELGMPPELKGSVNATNLQTFRWRWRNRFNAGFKSNGQAKAMVDLSRLSKGSLTGSVSGHNPHRPVKKECLVRNMYLDVRNSTFLVHHYASTWEQWSARKRDARQTTENNGRTREAWEKLRLLSFRQTDHIRPWLQDFVNVYGAGLAAELLKGSGELPFTVNSSSDV